MSSFDRFAWQVQEGAGRLVKELVDEAVHATPWLEQLAQRLRDESGTRLLDWIDFIRCPPQEALPRLGFEEIAQGTWTHPGGLFPALLPGDGESVHLAIKVEDIESFLTMHSLHAAATIWGAPVSRLRIADVELEQGGFTLVQRLGDAGFACAAEHTLNPLTVSDVLEDFQLRPREGDGQAALDAARELFERGAEKIGPQAACSLFFQAERNYWESRNRAAQIQYGRQARLGMGWANHDHHTYRCSRRWFAPLVSLFETMGFTCRERFYAGADAGWGAQVLEHPECGIVIFADVDMSAEEVAGDFAHEGLPESNTLGTVGLWCALHGDSIFTAGMHHLECQFDFDAARDQLAECGVETMAPFTDFPHLRQAFTKGELWTVSAERLKPLVEGGLVSEADAERFATTGALGSHLEILERNHGYKGFNQSGINEIIRQTNPKTAH